jgi:hypothetical protein
MTASIGEAAKHAGFDGNDREGDSQLGRDVRQLGYGHDAQRIVACP